MLVICCLFAGSHSDGCEVILHYGLEDILWVKLHLGYFWVCLKGEGRPVSQILRWRESPSGRRCSCSHLLCSISSRPVLGSFQSRNKGSMTKGTHHLRQPTPSSARKSCSHIIIYRMKLFKTLSWIYVYKNSSCLTWKLGQLKKAQGRIWKPMHTGYLLLYNKSPKA